MNDSKTEAAKNVKISALNFSLILFFISGVLGLASIDLFPKALAPNSDLPTYLPIILFSYNILSFLLIKFFLIIEYFNFRSLLKCFFFINCACGPKYAFFRNTLLKLIFSLSSKLA